VQGTDCRLWWSKYVAMAKRGGHQFYCVQIVHSGSGNLGSQGAKVNFAWSLREETYFLSKSIEARSGQVTQGEGGGCGAWCEGGLPQGGRRFM